MKRIAIATPLVLAAVLVAGCTDASEPTAPTPSVQGASAPVPTDQETSVLGPPAPTSSAEPTGPAPVTAEGVTPDPDSPSAAGAVDWAKYDDGLQEVIDELAADEDCEGLQEQFGEVLASDAAAESGDLLSYIDDRIQAAGCQ